MRRVKKSLIFLLFVLLIIPFTTRVAYADYTCADIKDKVDQYDKIEEEIESLKCNESYNATTTTQCNNLSLKKNLILTELFEINDMKIDCDKTLIKPIIEKNQKSCNNELSSSINSIAKMLFKNFYVVGTVLFIIFGSLDLFKNVINADPKEMPKNRKKFLKRLIALILLYLAPVIINMIFAFLPNHYRLGTTKYVCNAKSYYTKEKGANTISGYYSKDLITATPTGGSSRGKAIAEAAKTIKQSAISNGYTYGCNYQGPDKQGSTSVHKMCCAELLGAALYKAGIYDLNGARSYQTASAPGLGNILKNKGWILITNEKDLQPGDVIFYEKLAKQSEAGIVYGINGRNIHVCHTDIYYGNGKKVSTGGGFNQSNLVNTFKVKGTCYGVSQRFAFAFRFPGKK